MKENLLYPITKHLKQHIPTAPDLIINKVKEEEINISIITSYISDSCRVSKDIIVSADGTYKVTVCGKCVSHINVGLPEKITSLYDWQTVLKCTFKVPLCHGYRVIDNTSVGAYSWDNVQNSEPVQYRARALTCKGLLVLGATSNECSACAGKRLRLHREKNLTTNYTQAQPTTQGIILPALNDPWPLLDQLPADNRLLLKQQIVNSACSDPRQRRWDPRYFIVL